MPASDYTPTVAEVARHIRARTRTSLGVLAGTFNTTTNPTDTQVDEHAAEAARELERHIGSEIDATLFEHATDVAAMMAAAQIELSYFPEAVRSGKSVYDQLVAMIAEKLPLLKSSVNDVAAGETMGSADDGGHVQYFFESDEGGLVDWQTQW